MPGRPGGHGCGRPSARRGERTPLTSVGFDAKEIVDVAVAAMMAELGYPVEHEPSARKVARLIQRSST